MDVSVTGGGGDCDPLQPPRMKALIPSKTQKPKEKNADGLRRSMNHLRATLLMSRGDHATAAWSLAQATWSDTHFVTFFDATKIRGLAGEKGTPGWPRSSPGIFGAKFNGRGGPGCGGRVRTPES